jgi:KDO2-lipid IV(A) lauroyltransferase
MSAKKRSPLADYSVYLGVRFAVAMIQALPWSWALSLANMLAWLAYHVNRRHREVARENLRQAFPDQSAEQIDKWTYGTYEHLMHLLIEMVRLPRELHRHNAPSRVAFAEPRILAQAEYWLSTGRPLILITGHLGNWEALGYAMGLMGYRGHIIARRLDNPYLDRFLTRFRAGTGQVILDKNNDFDRIIEVLENGGYLAALADQDAGPRGEFVSFFGRPASTFKSLALLSLRYDAPILVMGAARTAPCLWFRAYLEEEIDPREYVGLPDATRLITQRYTAALEAMIRRHPEQYFWLHRRWKHQPKVREKKQAA